MRRRKDLDLVNMSDTELVAFHDRMVLRILCLNGLWLLFVITVIFWSFTGGMILLIMSALKYWFDYTDTESLTVYDAFSSLMSRMLAPKNKDGSSDN